MCFPNGKSLYLSKSRGVLKNIKSWFLLLDMWIMFWYWKSEVKNLIFMSKCPKHALWASVWKSQIYSTFWTFLGTVEFYQPDFFSSVSGISRHKFWVPTTILIDQNFYLIRKAMGNQDAIIWICRRCVLSRRQASNWWF